jgi:signal transduction histidine kinase
MTIIVDAPETLSPLPAAFEVAAYRVALEGITNAARHSGARTCTVRISIDDALQVEVIDDGKGLRDGWRPGVGVASLNERADELGGSCAIESEPGGGVHLTVRLPLEKGRS